MLPNSSTAKPYSVDFSHNTLGRGLSCVINGSKIENGGNYLSAIKRFIMAIFTGTLYNQLADLEIEQKSALLKTELPTIANAILLAGQNASGKYECDIEINGKTYTVKEDAASVRIFEKNNSTRYVTLDCTVRQLKTAMLNALLRSDVAKDGFSNLDLDGIDLASIDITKLDLNKVRIDGFELARICAHGGNISGAELTDLLAADRLSFKKVCIDCAQLVQLNEIDADISGASLCAASLRERIKDGEPINGIDLTQFAVPQDVDVSALKLNKVKLNEEWVVAILISAAEKQNPNDFIKKVEELRESILENPEIIGSLEIQMSNADGPAQWKLSMFLNKEYQYKDGYKYFKPNIFYETNPQKFGNNRISKDEFGVKLIGVNVRLAYLFKICKGKSGEELKAELIDEKIACMTDGTQTIDKEELRSILDSPDYSRENLGDYTVEDSGATFTVHFKDRDLVFSNRGNMLGEFRGAKLRQALYGNNYDNLRQMLESELLTLESTSIVYIANAYKNNYAQWFPYGSGFAEAPQEFLDLLAQEKITDQWSLSDFFKLGKPD